MAPSHPFGQLCDGTVDDVELIRGGVRAGVAAESPDSSATRPSIVVPARSTIPAPPAVTSNRSVSLVAFTPQVPFLCGPLDVLQPQFPHEKGISAHTRPQQPPAP